MRFTFADVQSSRIPPTLSVGPNDTRLLQWVNEAILTLLPSGKWWGTFARFNMCATNGCITLPKQIAAIEAVNLNGRPTPVRDMWYEFIAYGMGTRESQGSGNTGGCCGGSGSGFGWCSMNEAVSRGQFPVFTDIKGSTSKANFICDMIEDVGNRVLVLGYDQNGNWIRTLQNGLLADGELLILAQNPGVTSTNYFQVITGVQFLDAPEGQSWLYGMDTANSNLLTMLGHYQYDETNPSYTRYYFPSIMSSQSSQGSACTQTKVEIIGKLDFVPVKNPTDYLLIQSIPALKAMMKGIKDAENEMDGIKKASILASAQALAEKYLDEELDHHLGSGRTVEMPVANSSAGNEDPVMNFL